MLLLKTPNKACTGADGYNEESWHKRTSQNEQRQGKNDHGKNTKLTGTDLVHIRDF